MNLRMEKAMKINLDSPLLFFNYSCRFYDIKYSVHFMCVLVITMPGYLPPFTRVPEARHRVDIYSNLFSKHLKIISSRCFLLSILYLIMGAIFVFGVKFLDKKSRNFQRSIR